MKSKKYYEKRREMFKKLRNKGKSYAAIGRKYGVSKQCVHQSMQPPKYKFELKLGRVK